MDWKYRTTLSFILVLLALILAGSGAFAQMYQAKVDNFIFLYDQSSSMDEIYQKQTIKRTVLAREAMEKINEDIPELEFKSGLYSVAPSFKTYQAMFPYNSDRFAFAVSELSPAEKRLGPQTPLSEGLAKLEPILSSLSGSTAILLFSDGGENRGGSPANVMKELYHKFDVCFHFVSYAHTEEEKAEVERMGSVRDCSYGITGEAVQDPQARKEFVKKIFYKKVKDSDGDGVIDSRDRCPDTPPGVKVDKYGCPIDSDGDAVPDYLDKCPDTPKDLVVDEFGCPVPKRITLDIKFAFDKARIKPKYHDELKKVADFLKDRPEVNIVVEGHTDSIGTDEYNQKLSQRRASSVKQYLIEKFGISADRISIKAYGETRPIADNDTPAGQQKNRRVEGVFPEVFQKK